MARLGMTLATLACVLTPAGLRAQDSVKLRPELWKILFEDDNVRVASSTSPSAKPSRRIPVQPGR